MGWMKRLWFMAALVLAVGVLGRTVAAAPDETRMYRVAEAAFRDGLNDLAERQFADYLKQFPDSDRADGVVLDMAQAQLAQGKWQAAVKTLEDALAKWPTEKRPDSFRFWLAEALLHGERYAEAEQRYAEVIDKYPHSAYRPQALYGLAFARFKQGHFDEARRYTETYASYAVKGLYTVRLDPESRDTLWRIAGDKDVYGDPFQWPRIWRRNSKLIKDPDLIQPGWQLIIPR